MTNETLQTVLEREHHEIDAGIEPSARGTGPTDRAALQRSVDGLRRHIYAEEELLFPSLRAAGLMGPVMVMLREHARMWETLDALDRSLGAAGDEELSSQCADLLAQLESHNQKEELILYPQVDTALSADALAELRTFLSTGELPAGWTAQLLQG